MSLDKLRVLPEFQGASDAEILGALSKTAGVPLADVASAFGADTGGKWGNRLSASVDSYQAGLLGVGEAAFGSDTLGQMRRRNEAEANLGRSIAQRQGAIMSYKDVGGVGDALDYVGGLAVDSAPYLVESLAGGLVARGLSTGLRGVASAGRAVDATADAVRAGTAAEKALATRSTLGGVAASYPSAVGDILQNQREQSGGETDLGAAALGGLPYAALNALGIEGALSRGTLTRSGIRALDDMAGLRGVAARTGVSMLKNAAVEAPSELGQEFVNQYFGRMAVDPNETFFNDKANERYLESAIGGAALGGVFGGAAGGWRRSEGYVPPGQTLDDQSKPTNLLGGNYNLTTDMGALPPLQQRIDQNLGLTLPQGMNKSQQADYTKLFNQAYNEPSGRRVVDPATGIERELTVGELLEQEAQQTQSGLGDVGRVPLTLAPYGPTDGPLAGAAQSIDLETLRSDLGELAAMAEVAQRSGDAAQLEALNAAMRQTFDQIKALETQGTAGQSELFFPNGAPTYGADAGLPNLTTQLDPLQQRIDQNLGLTRQGAPRNYPQQFQAAASEPTNLFAQDPATGREIRLDMGQASQIRAGDNVQLTPEQIRAQEVGAAAAQEKQAIEGRKERTAAAGLDPKKVQHVQAWSYIEEALDNGVIDQPEAARLAANVASGIDKVGGIQKYLTGLAATKQAIADGKAQETQAALDKVQKQPTNGTPTTQAQQAAAQGPQAPAAGAPAAAVSTQAPVEVAGTVKERVQQRLNAWAEQFPQMPKYDWLSNRELAQLEDLENRGELNLSAAQTVLGANQAPAKPTQAQESDDAADFRRNLTDNLDKMGAEDRFIFQEWLGVDVDEDGNLELRESGGKSYASIGAKLPNSKTGQIGMSREAVRKKVNAALKDLGYEGTVSPKMLHQRLGFALAGTDLETINRNVDLATQDDTDADPVELDQGGATGTTADGEARAAEMESGTNDDAGTKEDGYDVDLDAARQREQEAGILMDQLDEDLASGRVLESDIEETRYVFDKLMGKGAGAFDSKPVSDQAAAIRQYAAVRARGTDPVIKIAQEGVSNGKRTQPTASGREAVPGGTDRVREDRVQDGDVRTGSTGQAGQEVRQTGNQTQAAAVVVKKKRRVVTPAAEDRPATPFVPRAEATTVENQTPATVEETVLPAPKVDLAALVRNVGTPSQPTKMAGMVAAPTKGPIGPGFDLGYALNQLPKVEPTQEPAPEWATNHVADLGGEVVYFDADTALVSGYNILTGQALYSGVHRATGNRTRVDIRSFTGNLFTPEQKANLAAQANRLDAESKAKQKQNPDGPFVAGDSVAATDSISPALADYVRGLLKTLNMDGVRVFLLDPSDVRGNREKYKLFGTFSSAGSAGLDANEDGSMRKFGDRQGDFYISLRPGMPTARSIETLAHEVGHIVQRVAYENADAATKTAIKREYDAWYAANKGKNLKEVIPELRNRETAAAHIKGVSDDLKPSSYWLSFNEWFADNVSRWATTADKPMSLADKFFKSVAEQIRKLAAAVAGKKYVPNPAVAKFLDEMTAGKFESEPINVTPFVPRGVASTNEQETSSKPSQGATQPQNAPVAGSTGQVGPGQQKESVGSRSEQADRGVPAAEVVADLKEFLRKDVLGRKVIVVQRAADLPKGIKVSSKSKTQGVAIDDGPYGRVAYLIADNLTRDNIRAVFMHEVGSHLALDNMLNTQAMANLVDQIKSWAKLGIDGSTKQEHVLAANAARRVQKSVKNPSHYRSELLAYFIEEAVLDGITPTAIQTDKQSPLMAFLRKALALFKDIITELGVRPQDITAQDIVDLAYGAAQLEMADTGPIASGESLTRENAKFSKPAYMAKAPSELWETAQGAMAWLKDWTFTRGAFTRDLLNKAAELMPAAKTYLDEMQRARVESVKLEREVASIVDDASALAAHERGTGPRSINALIRRMTYENKWAFAPEWVKNVKPDAELAEWFDGLSKEAQAVVKRVFKHGHDSLLAAQRAAIDSIESEVNPLIDAARAKGDLETVKELEKAKVQADGKFRRLIEIRGQTPYAPLRRFGNWAVVVKSKMYQDAQARGDEAEMDRLSRDGNHYRVEFKSNQLSATARAKALQQELGDVSVQAFERGDDALLYGGESMFKAFSRFRNLAREKIGAVDPSGKQTKAEAEVTTALDKTLASMYMALVAETSARTSEFERKNVAGADMDMMRAFATQGRAMANFIGSLKTSGKIMDTLRTMKKQTYSGTNQAEKSKLYNEILRRHAMGLNYEPNQLLDKSLAANSYWSLITSPSYLLTNLTQPWVVSVPVLAGKFGLGRSSSEMMRAYKEIGRIATKLVDNPDAVKDLPKDVQAVVSELFNRGSIDISLGADLGSFTSGGESELSARTQKILRLPRTLAERGEMVNRAATAVAAYRLAKAQKMSTEDAIDYADKVIYETHGDYSAFNAPRVMRNPVGRFATQFRKFQLIQIALYGRLIKDATKGLNPQERKAAQQALLYTLGTTFALGGLTAMPGYTAISFLAGSVLGLGDDDEPDDPEATLRRLLGGGAEADAILRGVPNLMGLNIGSRIGAAGMLSILPYTDLEASRDGYKDILLGLAGPFFGGTLPKALDGVGLISNGDYWKGLELLMPRGVADAMRGIRFAAEGVSKRNGDVTLSADEINFFEGALQAIGLPPKDITDNQMLRNSQFKADEFYKDRTSQLKRQYVEAYRDGDGATMQEVRQSWMEAQDARRRLGIKVQPLSELLKAPQEQRKRESRLQEESLLLG